MKWQSGLGWQMQNCGPYAVTKHPILAGGFFYIAWHDQTPLGEYANVEAARAECVVHESSVSTNHGQAGKVDGRAA